jgi:hypothetical protein
VTTLFDDIVDGSGRVYFDELDESPGISTAAAAATVAVSCSAAGVVVAAAAVTAAWTAGAGSTTGTSPGLANASVSITAANEPLQTLVYIPPTTASIEIFAFASNTLKLGVARSSVVIAATAAAVTPIAPATATVTIGASAQALLFGVAQASVEVSGAAAGNNVDLTTSPATANVSILAGATPRQLATAAAAVAMQASAVGTIASLVGIARAQVTISAQAAEAAGVLVFPRASAQVSIAATAVGAAVAAPVRATIPVIGKSIDFKTIADAHNAQQPPVPEYEFGYGKARRVFRRSGT